MRTPDKLWADAEKRVHQISKRRRHRPRPEHILDDARHEGSPLHYLFNWDDESAAENQRLETARRVLRRVKFVVEFEEETICAPGFYADPDLECDEQGYVAHPLVAGDDGLAMRVCLMEFERAKSLLERGILSANALEVDCSLADKALVILDKMIVSITA